MILRTFVLVTFLSSAFAPFALAEFRRGKAEEKALEDLAKKHKEGKDEYSRVLRELADNRRAVLTDRDLEVLKAKEEEFIKDRERGGGGELTTLYTALRGMTSAPGNTRYTINEKGVPTAAVKGSAAAERASSGVGSNAGTASSGGSAGTGGAQPVSAPLRARLPEPPLRSGITDPAAVKKAQEEAQAKAKADIISMAGTSLPPGEQKAQEQKRERALDEAKKLPVPKDMTETGKELLVRMRTRRAMETFDPEKVDAVDATLGIKDGAAPMSEAAIRGMNYLSDLMDGGAAYALTGDHAGAKARIDALDAAAKERAKTDPAGARSIVLQADALREAERVSREAEKRFGSLPALLKDAKLDKEANDLSALQKKIEQLSDFLAKSDLSPADKLKFEKEMSTLVLERAALLDRIQKLAPAGSKLRQALEEIESKYADALFEKVAERLAALELLGEIRAKLLADPNFKGDINKEVQKIFDERWEKEKKELTEKQKPTICRKCAGGFPGGLRAASGCGFTPGANTGGVTKQRPAHASPPKP